MLIDKMLREWFIAIDIRQEVWSTLRILSKESTHDRVVASRVYDAGLPEYIGREVAPMTAYEIISIFIGILALLMSFGSLLVALLAFLDKRNKRK